MIKFLIPFILCFCLAADCQEKLKIGFVLPLSGDWAFLGSGVKNSALLAKEDLENRKYDFEFIFEDNSGRLKDSSTAAKRLIELEKVNVIISLISGVGKLINPLAERAKVINVGICSSLEVANGDYNFISYITAEQGVKEYLSELEKRRISEIVVFTLNEAGFNLITEELKKQAEDKITIRVIETFEKGSNDFRPQILRSLKNKPGAILILGLSPEIEILAKQLKELGKDIQLSSIESFGLAENKQVFSGAWYVDAAQPNQAFIDRYKQRYNLEITAGVGHTYDTIMMLAKAYEQLDPSEMDNKKAIEQLFAMKTYQGILGLNQIQTSGIVQTQPTVRIIKY